MQRRNFSRIALLSTATLASGLARAQTLAGAEALARSPENTGQWQALERASQGRLGVAAFDTQSGEWLGHRLDERFAMCSTFKWLAAAHVLRRVDQGLERLDRRIEFGREALLPWSPVTEKHAGGAGMTVAELCHAAITVSDNAAARGPWWHCSGRRCSAPPCRRAAASNWRNGCKPPRPTSNAWPPTCRRHGGWAARPARGRMAAPMMWASTGRQTAPRSWWPCSSRNRRPAWRCANR